MLEQLQINDLMGKKEKICLLGKQYDLMIVESDDNRFEMDDNQAIFYVTDVKRAEAKLKECLHKEFLSIIAFKGSKCYETFRKKHNIPFVPEFKIKKMSKRWGSSTQNGLIYLNPMLISVPIKCIEYVIFHELTHLLHSSHEENFFKTLKSVCPQYKRLKEKLETETDKNNFFNS